MKYIFLLFFSISLAACKTQDEAYYRRNPQALERALQNCPRNHPPNVNCEQLVAIAIEVNELVYQLQANPQIFGKKILALQEQLAKQQANLQLNPNQPALEQEIGQIKQQLGQRLAIVKWLESPES